MLGERLPKPPQDVPQLPEDEAALDGLTVRQVTEKHTSDPACAKCHMRFDPYGFALESFDAIGRPNRNGGGRYLRSYCPRRDVVAVADRDDHGDGQRDAMALARSLFARCCSVRVIEPPEPHNDLRDWLRDGATNDDVQRLIRRVEPWVGRVVAAATE